MDAVQTATTGRQQTLLQQQRAAQALAAAVVKHPYSLSRVLPQCFRQRCQHLPLVLYHQAIAEQVLRQLLLVDYGLAPIIQLLTNAIIGTAVAAYQVKTNVTGDDVAMLDGLNDVVHGVWGLLLLSRRPDYKKTPRHRGHLKLSAVQATALSWPVTPLCPAILGL